MRRPVIAAAIAALVVVVGLVGWAIGRSDGSAGDADGPRVSTVAAVRTDLVRVRELSGELGFGPTTTVSSRRSGTVTWVPEDGTVVVPGDTVYRIDERPVVLIDGDLPAYRVLSTLADDGPDVEDLEATLAALGDLDADLVDEHFTTATRRAVEDLQERVGLPVTGRVEPGDVVVAPGPRRVERALVDPGDLVGVGSPMAELSSSSPAVTLEVGADDRRDLAVGDEVGVVLPNGDRTTGTVSDVAAAPAPLGPDGRPTTEARYEITVSVEVGDEIPVDGSTVTVEVTEERADDAVVVPVAALLALSEGGFAVEVVADGAPPPGRLVGVETGVFAGGRVEVLGDVEPGDLVVVPAR